MAKKPSAGILVYRKKGAMVEVLLGHPGGPYWAKKDQGAWSIPKGEAETSETLFLAAQREFAEEIGHPAPEGTYVELGSFTRSDGRAVTAWAVEGDLDVSTVSSNTLEIEWPPKSGKQLEIPEIDRAVWVSLVAAPAKMHRGQDIFITRLAELLRIELPEPPVRQPLF